jgi:hypothetical protein
LDVCINCRKSSLPLGNREAAALRPQRGAGMILLLAILFLQGDGTPPSIVSVTARGDATKSSSSSAGRRYSQFGAGRRLRDRPGVKIESASRGSDLRTIALVTSPLVEGVSYTLRIAAFAIARPRPSRSPPREAVHVLEGSLLRPARPDGHSPRMPKFSKPVLFNTRRPTPSFRRSRSSRRTTPGTRTSPRGPSTPTPTG